VFCETPCVQWILDRRVVWDLFYEHCALFTAASLTTAFETAGFTVDHAGHVFGGQYLWLEARPGPAPVTARPGPTPQAARDFGREETRRCAAWRRRIETWTATGRVAVWGAGAKGVTFAHLVDPEATRLDCVVDVNAAKQGRFLPGTAHPIVAPDALGPRGVDTVIVLNPNYVEEIEADLARRGPAVAVVDLMHDGTESDEADHRHGHAHARGG
jgi:hypothetical protein